jgi:hypothetical protein
VYGFKTKQLAQAAADALMAGKAAGDARVLDSMKGSGTPPLLVAATKAITRTAKLSRRAGTPLGLAIKNTTTGNPAVRITMLVPEGQADLTRKLFVTDTIKKVNGDSTDGMDEQEVTQLIQASQGVVELEVQSSVLLGTGRMRPLVPNSAGVGTTGGAGLSPGAITVTVDRSGGKALGIEIGNAPNASSGVKILAVSPGGQVGLTGKVAAGDEILSINGTSVLGFDKAGAAQLIIQSTGVFFEIKAAAAGAHFVPAAAAESFDGFGAAAEDEEFGGFVSGDDNSSDSDSGSGSGEDEPAGASGSLTVQCQLGLSLPFEVVVCRSGSSVPTTCYRVLNALVEVTASPCLLMPNSMLLRSSSAYRIYARCAVAVLLLCCRSLWTDLAARSLACR